VSTGNNNARSASVNTRAITRKINTIAANHLSLIDEAFDSVVSQSRNEDNSVDLETTAVDGNVTTQGDLKVLFAKVESLLSVVASQNCTIQRLTNKLNSIFSMFDLTEDDIKLNDDMVTRIINTVSMLNEPTIVELLSN